ncbi:GlxA family transcriptional regulator [Pseudogulbenkiania subflava]|uniref:Transcriptional regulator GlxA family, contains an amidase domain and an AraC-type DNA-binding HTH domain n=1 Tax=Pseudogulbenkiania subflava DSM 22618 TaxID=1123014 RepID=A0A1Y6CBK3_9NEIS|nr:GlxA family transcriptional regulator [Pseudogulbenkiania subflava]SMF46424.1 Transcriptional regulator GlxA family, contains an amidase domain and an AraC-type DNA-binding HTH domain [Pseudogulbenkiania subflava DSM 22618]
MAIQTQVAKPLRYGILLLPHAAMADLALITEVLSRANQLAEKKLYEFLLLSPSGDAMTLTNGIKTAVDLPLSYAPKLDGIFVIADEITSDVDADELGKTIHAQATDKLQLIGIGCGSYWLARAGLLNSYRSTIHWQEINRFTEEFPEVIVSSNLYEIDRNRMSCAGGASTLDFMMVLVGQQHGHEFAAQLSELFSMERIRPGNERQRIPLATRIGASQPKLTEAVSLMEANIEEPLTTDDIAYYVGISRRQLERLFKQHLSAVPSKYYLELRLKRARQLLQQTSKSIVQIGLACGFSSGPHFSSSYRNHFGITPREERSSRNTGKNASE